MRGCRAAVIACLLALPAAALAAEEAHIPVPYAPQEFPVWVRDLRRAEIVFFGTLPFSLFTTFEAYDVARFVASGFAPPEGFDLLLAPWPFRAGSEIWAEYSAAEKGWLIATAITLSLSVAVVDYLIVHRPVKREDR